VFFWVGPWIDTHAYNRRPEVRELEDVEELEEVQPAGAHHVPGGHPNEGVGSIHGAIGVQP